MVSRRHFFAQSLGLASLALGRYSAAALPKPIASENPLQSSWMRNADRKYVFTFDHATGLFLHRSTTFTPSYNDNPTVTYEVEVPPIKMISDYLHSGMILGPVIDLDGIRVMTAEILVAKANVRCPPNP